MAEFSDRVVLVTGVTGGLGPAVVETFLGAGATVVGVSRSVENREDSNFISVAADLTKPEGAETAVTEAMDQNKRLDCVVHLVGGFAGGSPVGETDDDTWAKMMTLNLQTAFYILRAAVRPMTKAAYGRIVAVGSRAGIEPDAKFSAYSVSKAALHALIRTVARETVHSGVTANAVLPSIIDTPANRRAMPDADFSKWVKPEAIAQQIRWLCSDDAADVSGALIPIYGRA